MQMTFYLHMQISHVHTTWLICLLISHVYVGHGYFAYVIKISFASPENLVLEGVAGYTPMQRS